jgi:glycosyltransferase involved in cell wall biosynthesis
LGRNPTIDRWLSGNSAVRIGLKNRVAWNLRRAQAILSDLSALIVPNAFARSFYMQFGVSEDRIFVQPWYYDLTVPVDRTPADSRTTVLGYIGRISPEKGVQRIFEALLNDTIAQPVHLVVAGAIDSAYATQLHSKYRNHVGKHSVEWMGWLPHADVDKFYQKVDAVIISSEWIENGPLTLIESYAFKRPVIATDTPTSRDLVRDGETGYLVTFSSTESLAKVINRVSREAGSLYRMRHNLPTITTSVAYAASTKCIYETIALLKIHALKI